MKVTISGFYDEVNSNLDTQIALIKELKESYMCPRNINGKNIADYTAEEFENNILPILEKNAIKFSSIGSPIGKIDISDEEGFTKQKAQLTELIKIAQMTKCKYIRVFSFFYGKKNPDDCFDMVVKKFGEFLSIAKGSGVKLMHENEKKIYGDIPERVIKLYNALKCEELTMCFDASNYVQCSVDPIDALMSLKEYTEYYHIKDCSKYMVEVPVGIGEGQYRKIISVLKQDNYEGFFTLEPHTLKYSLLKMPVYLFPFMPLIMNNYYKAFRQIDKAMKVGFFKNISRKQVFIWQYNNIKKIISEV